MSNRAAFKVARVASGDAFVKLQPAKDVPNLGLISLDKYNKDYTVSIGDDILVYDEEQVEEARKLMGQELEKFKQPEEASDKNTDAVEE